MQAASALSHTIQCRPVWCEYMADLSRRIITLDVAQAEAQLAQQQQAPPSSALDMTFDWLGLDITVPVTTTTGLDTALTQLDPSSLLTATSTSPMLGGSPVVGGFLSNEIHGEPLSDMDMADVFLDAHTGWYALYFPMTLVPATS